MNLKMLMDTIKKKKPNVMQNTKYNTLFINKLNYKTDGKREKVGGKESLPR